MRVTKFCYENLYKDYGYLKLLFIVLCGLIFYEELHVFFVEKPTLTKVVRTILTKEDYPEIILCPEPSVDLNKLRHEFILVKYCKFIIFSRYFGYEEIWSYATGVDYSNQKNPIPIGWRGNQTNKSVKEVLNDISVLKTVDDCPSPEQSFYWYEPNEMDPENIQFMKFELTRGLSPHFVCCKVVNPEDENGKTMNGISISLNASNISYKSMKVLLSDKMSSSVFTQHDTNIWGDHIETPKEDNGYFHYKVKLSKEENLENDPNYPCIDYKQAKKFHQCIQNEFINENIKMTNCTPPWMTDDESLWCQGNLTLVSRFAVSKWSSFVVEVNAGIAQYDTCSIPCRNTKYSVKEFGFKEDKEMKGIIIIFDNVVEKTISELQIGGRTLVTRFGGIIGVGKNLLWVVIFAISAVGFCSSKTKKDKHEKDNKFHENSQIL